MQTATTIDALLSDLHDAFGAYDDSLNTAIHGSRDEVVGFAPVNEAYVLECETAIRELKQRLVAAGHVGEDHGPKWQPTADEIDQPF